MGFSVDFFRDDESFATGFGETDAFFEPIGTCGLHVNASAMFGEGAADGWVD